MPLLAPTLARTAIRGIFVADRSSKRIQPQKIGQSGGVRKDGLLTQCSHHFRAWGPAREQVSRIHRRQEEQRCGRRDRPPVQRDLLSWDGAIPYAEAGSW